MDSGRQGYELLITAIYPTNKQRYLVYAQRASKDHEETKTPAKTTSKCMQSESKERLWNRLAIGMGFGICIFLGFSFLHYKRKHR